MEQQYRLEIKINASAKLKEVQTYATSCETFCTTFNSCAIAPYAHPPPCGGCNKNNYYTFSKNKSLILSLINKTIMKNQFKKLSLILLLLISTQWLQAQTEKTPSPKVPDYIQNADYVFEGTAVDITGYWTTLENGNRVIYTSLLIEVSNVFKGNGIKKGLIQVIVQGGSARLENDTELIATAEYYGSHDVRVPIFTQKGTKGIIYGKASTKGFNWNKKLENNIVIEHNKALIYCIECSNEKFDNLQTDWGIFNNLSQLRKSIRSFNLKTDYIDLNREDIVSDSIQSIQDSLTRVEKQKFEEGYEKRVEDYKKHQEKVNTAVKSAKKEVRLKKMPK